MNLLAKMTLQTMIVDPKRTCVATKGRINRDEKIGSVRVGYEGKQVTLGYDRWVRRLLGMP